MSVNLQKGQKVNLRKEDGGALRRDGWPGLGRS